MQYDLIEHAGLSHVGVRRSHNQDAYAVQLASDAESWRRAGHIFLVADGMGGHAVGEKASAKAAQEIPHTYFKYAQDGPIPALRRAFLETNAGIHAVGQENPEFRGLGTTATALVLRADGAFVGHVGDSRAYRVRDGQIEQLTFDHSLVWALARQAGRPPEELTEIRRNVIIRSLGPDALVQVDIEGPYPVRAGDLFLLCSDGLSNQLTPEEMGAVASVLPPADACRLLVELANLRGGPDNITVVIVRVGAELGVAAPPPRRPSWLRRAARDWGRRVPWPLTVLTLGFALAMVFVLWSGYRLPGSTLVFAMAALAIGVGLVGLLLHAFRERRRFPAPDPETAPRLSVYRRHACSPDRVLLDRFTKMNDQLDQQAVERTWPLDLQLYHKHRNLAEELLRDGDLPAAFREQCRAAQLLAHCFNQNRQKEEVFQPKWDQTPVG